MNLPLIIAGLVFIIFASDPALAQTGVVTPGTEVNTPTTTTIPVPVQPDSGFKVILPDPVNSPPQIVAPVVAPAAPAQVPVQNETAPPAPIVVTPGTEPVVVAPGIGQPVLVNPVEEEPDKIVVNPNDEAAPPAEVREEKSVLEAIKERFYGTNYEMLPRKGTLMLKKTDLPLIYDAMRGVSVKSSGDVSVKVDTPKIAPSFYLKSVLFLSGNNWTAWINNGKYTPFYNRSYKPSDVPNMPQEMEMEVGPVFEDYVIVTWHSQNIDLISPGWRDNFIAYDPETDALPANSSIIAQGKIGSPGFISKDGTIYIDPGQGVAKAVLRPYQTFSTRNMKLSEGYVAPVIVPLPPSAQNQVNINPAAPANPPAIGQPAKNGDIPVINNNNIR